jgi:peptidase E
LLLAPSADRALKDGFNRPYTPAMLKRQIVAIGGGGFSVPGDDGALDDYVLSLTRKARPRVCFVATAGGDNRDYIVRFYEAFAAGRAEASHLPLFGVPRTDIRAFLLSQNVIFVGGGNTANMLAVWRVHGVDRMLREAWRRGIVLSGVSAGMLCWFEGGVTDSFGRPLSPLRDGLGLLRGSACPHYDGEPDRRPTYHRLLRRGLPAGVAVDDWAAIHYVGLRIHACIASRPGAKCYRLSVRGGAVRETELKTRMLTA